MVMVPTLYLVFDNCILFIISLFITCHFSINWSASHKTRAVNMPILYGNVRSSNNNETRKRMHLSIEPVIAYSSHVLYMWGLTSII